MLSNKNKKVKRVYSVLHTRTYEQCAVLVCALSTSPVTKYCVPPTFSDSLPSTLNIHFRPYDQSHRFDSMLNDYYMMFYFIITALPSINFVSEHTSALTAGFEFNFHTSTCHAIF